jgi:hypothetical protein
MGIIKMVLTAATKFKGPCYSKKKKKTHDSMSQWAMHCGQQNAIKPLKALRGDLKTDGREPHTQRQSALLQTDLHNHIWTGV